jgi:hypothetical protein
VTPALFDHAKRVYEEMLKRSHKESIEHGQAQGEVQPEIEVNVFEGHLTRLFADLNIANPYYTKIKNALVGQNCIEQLRRGGGVGLSKWVLHCEPTEEGFRAIAERRRATKGQAAILEQRVKDLTHMTNDLVESLEVCAKDLQALKDRVDNLINLSAPIEGVE